MVKIDKTIRKVKLTPQQEWDAHAHHPLQTWQWGEFRKQMGIDVVRQIWSKDPEAAEGQITFHKIPYTPFSIGYFPKGPPPSHTMIESLKNIGREKRAIFIQLEPNVTEDFKSKISNFSALRPSHRPLFTRHTFILDLTKSEDELMKDMHSKTRYNLRVAQKHGVSIQEDNSDAAFESYLALNTETTSRQGFFAHNHTYHKTMWTTMHNAGIAHLFTATHQGKTLAAWIIFAWEKTLYYPYGTSSREHREVMAPTLLLWEIAKWGKTNGYTSFDLWGALPPLASTGQPDSNDPWYGFHRFKQGFNPKLVTFAGSYDVVIHPLLYRCYIVADTIRWLLLKRGFK